MKLRLIAIGALLVSACASFAADTTITMPSADVLTQRLKAIGMEHFMEKTNIITQLADQQKAPLGVAGAILEACADYEKYLTQGRAGQASRMFNLSKHLLFVAVLEDAPEALEELKGLGLYQSKL